MTTSSLLEGYIYTVNKNKVDLFLDKERIRKQEEQFKTILHNIPTNVMVIHDSKIVLKNRHCENLLNFVCDILNPKGKEANDPSFDNNQFFLLQQIFNGLLKEPKTTSTQLNAPKVSIFEMTSNKDFLTKYTQFELNLESQSKRVFDITIETVVLD